MADEKKRVLLVTTDILTPYKAGEVFEVSEEDAQKLLTQDNRQTDFGPKNPKVKVRRFDPDRDEHLLLENGYLNQEAAKKLKEKLNPSFKKKEI